jgi:hypothetical protein
VDRDWIPFRLCFGDPVWWRRDEFCIHHDCACRRLFSCVSLRWKRWPIYTPVCTPVIKRGVFHREGIMLGNKANKCTEYAFSFAVNTLLIGLQDSQLWSGIKLKSCKDLVHCAVFFLPSTVFIRLVPQGMIFFRWGKSGELFNYGELFGMGNYLSQNEKQHK